MQPCLVGHVMKLKSGYSLRIERPKVKYFEVKSFNKLIETLRKEFEEGDEE